MAPLVLAYILQVRRQFGQTESAFTHLQIQLVTFNFEQFLLANTCIEQCFGLQQIHVKSQQTHNRQYGNTNARQE